MGATTTKRAPAEAEKFMAQMAQMRRGRRPGGEVMRVIVAVHAAAVEAERVLGPTLARRVMSDAAQLTAPSRKVLRAAAGR